MGIRFECIHAVPFARDMLGRIWDAKPLFFDGRASIFLFGCPCGEKDSSKPGFWLRSWEHERHVAECVSSFYRISISAEDLRNGSRTIGGLASHVEKTVRQVTSGKAASPSLREVQGAPPSFPWMEFMRIVP